jgi:ATP-binding cassette subfamily B protein
VVVVAYRKATIALADEIVYLQKGTVADRGTHAELLERSPGYRDLVNAYERADEERRAAEQAAEDEGALT